MITYDIVRAIRAKGVILKRNCDKLRVSCEEGLLTNTQAEYIRKHRDEILNILDNERKLQHNILPPPELERADHLLGDGADRAQVDASLPSYLEALTACIQALETEFSSLGQTSQATSPDWTVYRDLSENTLLPSEVREQYRRQAETLRSALTGEDRPDDKELRRCRELLSQIERLRQERDQAAGRNCWRPGSKDELLRQEPGGKFKRVYLSTALEIAQTKAPSEVTVIMGRWNQMALKKKTCTVTRNERGELSYRLAGEPEVDQEVISKRKISGKTSFKTNNAA